MFELVLGGIEGQIILAEEKMKIKGPKDGKLQANFNGKAKSLFKNSDSLSLATTKSLVLLSIVGQEYCRGDFLGAIIEQAVTEPHQLVTFLIADELHWHNLKSEEYLTDDHKATLKKEARQLGAAYFEEHLHYFLKPLGLSVEKFKNNYPDLNTLEKISVLNQLAKDMSLGFEVVTWSQWVAHPQYQEREPGLNSLCQSEPELKASIAAEADIFAGRHQQEGDKEGLWKARSKGYLEEETPAIMWLAAALNYNFIVYPGQIRKPFEVAKAYFDKNREDPRCSFPEDLDLNLVANWLQVSFCRKAIEPPKLTTTDNNRQKDIATNKSLEEISNRLVISEVEATLKKFEELSLGENRYKFFSHGGTQERQESATISPQTLFNSAIEHMAYGITAAIIDKGGSIEFQRQLFEQSFASLLSIVQKQQAASSMVESKSKPINEIISPLAIDVVEIEAESRPTQASALKF
ncbi:Uncharacterised protein [Legionella beliardensis]|uniref:Uncharacterized protein n=1 Tax=Legionella beliardensis TaxID=91822 RepID=A0A378HXJ7_9GAMM|nr:hypothetical protein [Legionella beliardensis]STX27542.1 Uncharacterised protein [Legionella beliardensis]